MTHRANSAHTDKGAYFLSDAAPTAVTINHIFYPHLMDSILQHPDSWLAMRTASKTYYQQVQRLMYRHLAIVSYAVEQKPDPNIRCPTCNRSDCYSVHPKPYNELEVISPYGMRVWVDSQRYDILPAGETNIEGLGPFYKLLEHTEILDIPLGLPAHDLDWFVDQLENLKAVRLYQFAHRPAPGHGEIHYSTEQLPLAVPKLVIACLPPGITVATIPLNFPDHVRKVVTNITHWMSVGPGAYFINGDPFDLTSPLLQDMVFIFHAKQDMTTSATSVSVIVYVQRLTCKHFQWERFVDVITDIMVRSE